MQKEGEETLKAQRAYKGTAQSSKVEMTSSFFSVCALEDELLYLNQRWDKLDAMEYSNPKFNEKEYEALEVEIEEKHNLLMDLRSK